MRALLSVAIILALVVSALTTTAFTLPKGIVSPYAWPVQSTFVQMGYNTLTKETENSTFFYDAVNWQWHVRNNNNEQGGLTGTWWIGNDLYMYQTVPLIGEICTRLDMGFGIPTPDWFLTNSTAFHTLYQSHKNNASDPNFYKTLWTRKYSVGDVCIDCGNDFNYFSEGSTGAPFKLEAPSPFGEVVNEFYNWNVVSGFPNSTWVLPNVTCIDGGDAGQYFSSMKTKQDQGGLADTPKSILSQMHVAGQMYAIGKVNYNDRTGL